MLNMDSISAPVKPGLVSLFTAFFSLSIMGFGGVLPWARWMVVEKRHWMTPAEFNEAISLCQFLPGGNIVNLAVVLGDRFRGPLGSITAVSGLMVGPFAIVIALATLFARYSAVSGVTDTLAGVSAAGAGLVTGLAIKMAQSIRHEWTALLFAAIAFVAVGIFRMPLLAAVALLAPFTIAYAWRRVG
jgi:chromate transporter